jgi:hypothetical protein
MLPVLMLGAVTARAQENKFGCSNVSKITNYGSSGDDDGTDDDNIIIIIIIFNISIARFYICI